MFKLPWIFLCASNLTDFLFGSDATLTFTSTLVAICTEINSRREIVKPSLESLALAPTSRRVVPSWFLLHHCIRKRSYTSTTCIPKSMWLNFLSLRSARARLTCLGNPCSHLSFSLPVNSASHANFTRLAYGTDTFLPKSLDGWSKLQRVINTCTLTMNSLLLHNLCLCGANRLYWEKKL